MCMGICVFMSKCMYEYMYVGNYICICYMYMFYDVDMYICEYMCVLYVHVYIKCVYWWLLVYR